MKNEMTAKRLKYAMDALNLTAKRLSDKSGVSEPSISQYLHGTFAPKNKTAAKLAKVLKVNPMWLMGFDVPMERTTFSFDELLKLDDIEVSNRDFVLSMDELSRDMTVPQMDKVMLYAKFIKEQDKDKKDGD